MLRARMEAWRLLLSNTAFFSLFDYCYIDPKASKREGQLFRRRKMKGQIKVGMLEKFTLR